ncbi:MAG TPA: RsmE family RNA methyltransferase [bacterium]|nr:RsmE family RNA methyltransferase [bacterium]
MNLILVFPDDFVSKSVVRLTDYRATHIREVHRAPVGKTLRVGLAGGAIGEGKVTRVDGDLVEIETRIPEGRPETPSLSLVLALPRPQTLKKVLEGIGAAGVRDLILINTERVQKSFFSSRLLKDDAWMHHLRLGMEQGSNTYLTEVTVHESFRTFFEQEGRLRDAVLLLTHPATDRTLWDTELARPHPRDRRIVCAVGPEGGWLEAELEEFKRRGFQVISLGRTIHRVENAVITLLAQLDLLLAKFGE